MGARVTIQMAKAPRLRLRRTAGASGRPIFLHVAKDAAAGGANTAGTMNISLRDASTGSTGHHQSKQANRTRAGAAGEDTLRFLPRDLRAL